MQFRLLFQWSKTPNTVFVLIKITNNLACFMEAFKQTCVLLDELSLISLHLFIGNYFGDILKLGNLSKNDSEKGQLKLSLGKPHFDHLSVV